MEQATTNREPQARTDIADAVFRTAPLGLAVIDSDSGEIIESNETYCVYLGKPQNEVVGSTWMSFTHPDDLEGDFECVRKLYETGTTCCKRTKRYIRSDGTVIYVQITLTKLPARDAQRRHITMIENVTQVTKLRQERKRNILDLQQIHDSLFPAIAILSEFRDRETGEHLLRTRIYMRLLLENLQVRHSFSRKAIALISNSAMLHDIGKIGIPDNILLKKGKLSPEEFDVMKKHTSQGREAISQIQRFLASESMFSFAREIAECHHERWDGSGYPQGLAKNEIPFTARVMAVADVYDALRSKRPYKDALGHVEAVKIIRESAGSHFDPDIVSAFLEIEPLFAQVATMEEDLLEQIDA
jgi:PAS domain S-box-containing protein